MKPQHPQPISAHAIISLILALAFSLLSACIPTKPTASPTSSPSPTSTLLPATPTITPTLRPSPTATLPPLGTEGNPITIGFILIPEETQAVDATQEIAILLAEETGYFIKYLIYPDFESLSGAILNGDVHLFWLKPLEYLYLHQAGSAEVLLMTNHLGVYAYGVQFLAHRDLGFTAYFNPETNESYQSAETALQQFSGTRPCYLHNQSIPGYLLPQGLLANASIPTLDPVFVYNYSAVVRALYIQGICDFGVSYALTGDPRSAGDILQNLPDAENQVQVIWQSEGLIPNTNLAASTALPLAIRHKLQEAFLDLPDSPQGLDLLSQALKYDVESLRTADDALYQPLRAALAPLALNLDDLVFPEATP
jgi:phosphonate transport system substrate-binding protein